MSKIITKLKDILTFAILVPLLGPILLVVAFLYLVLSFPLRIWLCFNMWRKNLLQGRYVIFVYSNGPHWKLYVEENIIPKIESFSLVLNYSERKTWTRKLVPLEVRVYLYFSGLSWYKRAKKVFWSGHEHNPYALVFETWFRPTRVSFWRAFRDYKHGKPQLLKKQEKLFFESIETASKKWSS